MKKSTAIILSLMTFFTSFLFLRFTTFAQSSNLVDTVVNISGYTSSMVLTPAIVEAGEQSTVSIVVRDFGNNPSAGRVVEIYEQNASANLIFVQPTAPSDPEGNVTGSVTARIPGIYHICAKDVTHGVGTVLVECQQLTVNPVVVPNMGPEPTYTPGSKNTLSWTTNGNGTYDYYLEASTTADFSNIVSNSGWINTTTYTVEDLNDGQIYYYRVKARNNGIAESAWSNIVGSTQDFSGPTILFKGSSSLPPSTTVSDFDPNTTFTLSYTLSDPSGIGTRTLTVVLLNGSRVSLPYTATFDGTNWVATIKLGDLPKENGIKLFPAYSFFLEVSDSFGNVSRNGRGNIEISSLPEGEEIITTPGIPVLVGSEKENDFSFTWVPAYSSLTGEAMPNYEVEWCDNPSFMNCSSNKLKTERNSLTLENLEAGKWYIRVRAFDITTQKQSDWSAVLSFTISEEKPVKPIFPIEKPKEVFPFPEALKDIEDTIGKLDPTVKKTITFTALAGNMVAGMNVLLNLLGSIPYVLTQISIAFLSLLGFRKKGILSGYIYDSITKDPVEQAILRVFTEEDKLVWTDVTDAKGRYRTPELEDGKYRIVVTANEYSFPSKIITTLKDYPLERVYHGLSFTVKDGIVPDFSIPMDFEKATKTEIMEGKFISKTKWLWRIAHIVIFVVGLVFSLYALKTNPVWWNYLILSLYMVFLTLLFFSFLSKRDRYGVVRDSNGNPIPGVTIYLSDGEFGKVIATRVTDELGRYKFLVDEGLYRITVNARGFVLKGSDSLKRIRVMGGDMEVLSPNLELKEIG